MRAAQLLDKLKNLTRYRHIDLMPGQRPNLTQALQAAIDALP